MIPTFVLLGDFTPPRAPAHLRALGLSPAAVTRGFTGMLLRLEGLTPAAARQLSSRIRRCGGWADSTRRAAAHGSLALGLPSELRSAFVTTLDKEDPSPGTLAAEILEALRASQGSFRPWRLPSRALPIAGRTLIQGILNVTPDSFHDGGQWVSPRRAVERALRMQEEGADVVDVGGESTRPGSRPVSAREEIRRVLPVIEALQGRVRVPLSIDTTKSEVADLALGAGAEILNDVSGLSFDPRMAEIVARHRAGLIVSHIRGRPRTMMRRPRYLHLIPEVVAFLQRAVRSARASGVDAASILVDPGIGFGKTAGHNVLLLRHLRALHSTGRPILVGASRKSFLGRILGEGPDRRLQGSLAAAAAAVLGGASALRVHDVAETVRVARVVEAIRSATPWPPRS